MAAWQLRIILVFLVISVVASPVFPGWQCQHQGMEHRLLSEVHFPDLQNGWCVGHCIESEPAVILKTTNGGEEWVQVDHGLVLGHGWGIHFVDSMNGWIAGGDCDCEQHGWIIHTVDGGQTWEEQFEYWTIPYTRFYALYFVDYQYGWATVGGYYGRVYRTSNGGSDWEERWLPGLDQATYILGVHFENRDEGWVVGGHELASHSNGVIYHSIDGGITWERQGEEIQSILDDVCLYDVWFVDNQRGWAVGGGPGDFGGGIILHTDDGGVNWYQQHYTPGPNDVRLGGVSFGDANNGWVSGAEYSDEGAALLRTRDGGLTWEMDPGVSSWPLNVRFNGIHFVDRNNGWAVGDDMRIVKYSEAENISVTSPGGGETWWIGDSEFIQWYSSGTSGFVNIDLSYDNGFWNPLAQDIEDYNGGSYTWAVSGSAENHCVVRVSDSDGSPEDLSGVFRILEPWISIDSPQQGDQWWIGDTEQILWSSEHTSGWLLLDISFDGGMSWTSLDSLANDDGSYSLEISDSTSNTCAIRLRDADGFPQDISSFFPINEPSVSVIAPAPGDQWWIGETEKILWSSEHTTGEVNINISFNGGASWIPVDSCTADDGDYEYQVPDSVSTTCVIEIADGDGYPQGMSGIFSIGVLSADQTIIPNVIGLDVLKANPFRSVVTLLCRLPSPSRLSLVVYDLNGHRIVTVYDGNLPAGEWPVEWNIHQSETECVTPGVYIACMRACGRIVRTPLVLLP